MNPFGNRLVLWGVALDLVLLLAINYAPWANAILGTAPVLGLIWYVLAPFAIGMLVCEEIRKWLVRRTCSIAQSTQNSRLPVSPPESDRFATGPIAPYDK